jgi:hypothetical protein
MTNAPFGVDAATKFIANLELRQGGFTFRRATVSMSVLGPPPSSAALIQQFGSERNESGHRADIVDRSIVAKNEPAAPFRSGWKGDAVCRREATERRHSLRMTHRSLRLEATHKLIT